LHAIEGVSHGICVVACPKGRCRLAQGNLRAEVRMRTVQRLLEEVGLEPQRALLLHANQGETPQDLERRIREVAQTLFRLGPSALHHVVPISAERKTDRRPPWVRPTQAAANG
jgi:coenzyme F420-reducing hydrogenase delta subunit